MHVKKQIQKEPNHKPDTLQKILANMGLGSRREMGRLIEQGVVSINGKIAKLGDRASLTDRIRVNGQLMRTHLQERPKTRILMYHKPVGEICTSTDPEGRKTVFDRLPRLKVGRWIMIGRLDINTSGLLIFTNDGELANQWMHPSSEIEREYAVRVLGEVTPLMLKQLREGVVLEDGTAHFKSVTYQGGEGANSWYHVVLTEGKNREVRRLWEAVGVKVSRLTRIRFGNLTLPRFLSRGRWQEVKEISKDFLGKDKKEKGSRRS